MPPASVSVPLALAPSSSPTQHNATDVGDPPLEKPRRLVPGAWDESMESSDDLRETALAPVSLASPSPHGAMAHRVETPPAGSSVPPALTAPASPIRHGVMPVASSSQGVSSRLQCAVDDAPATPPAGVPVPAAAHASPKHACLVCEELLRDVMPVLDRGDYDDICKQAASKARSKEKVPWQCAKECFARAAITYNTYRAKHSINQRTECIADNGWAKLWQALIDYQARRAQHGGVAQEEASQNESDDDDDIAVADVLADPRGAHAKAYLELQQRHASQPNRGQLD